MAVHVLFCRAQFLTAAPHHTVGRFQRTNKLVGGHALTTTPAERRDEFLGKTCSEYIAGHPYHRTGIEHGINGTFAMVAHDEAKEGHTRLYRLVGMFIPYLHLVVVILKIGTVGICP